MLSCCLLTTLFAPVPASALEPNSFRIRGLGKGLSWLIDDEVTDLFRNPASLRRTTGLRLFTTLSNLQGSGDARFLSAADERRVDLFSPVTLGGTWSGEGPVAFGLIAEYQRSSFDLTLRDDDWSSGFAGLGSNRDEFTFTRGKVHRVSVMAPLAIEVSEDLTFGVRLSYEDFGGAFTVGERTSDFDGPSATTPIATGHLSVSEDSYSFERPRGVGAQVGVQIERSGADIDVVGGYYPAQFQVGLSEVDALIGSSALGHSVANIAQTFDPGALSVHVPALQIHQRARWELSEKVGATLVTGVRAARAISAVEHQDRSERVAANLTTGERSTVVETENERVDMGIALIEVPIRVGLQFDLAGRGIFALGLNARFYGLDIEAVVQPRTSETTYGYEGIDHGHPVRVREAFTDNDYTIADGQIWLGVASVPVAVELSLVEWLTLRLGAETFFPFGGGGEFELADVDQPDHSEVTMSDGTTAALDTDASTQTSPRRANLDAFASTVTLYTAGLGFRVGESITLDALSFANLTDLSQWKIGVGFTYQL